MTSQKRTPAQRRAAATTVASVVLVVVGLALVLGAVDELAGRAWATLLAGLALGYTGYVLSTKVPT